MDAAESEPNTIVQAYFNKYLPAFFRCLADLLRVVSRTTVDRLEVRLADLAREVRDPALRCFLYTG